MTASEAIAKLKAMQAGTDEEIAHSEADAILIAVLEVNGLIDVADAWEAACERVGFWYS